MKGRFGATLVRGVLTKVSMRSHVEKKITRVVTHSKYLLCKLASSKRETGRNNT